jgi:hypothetical protein
MARGGIMEEIKIKMEWETPELVLLSVNDNTEGGQNAGEDYLEQS